MANLKEVRNRITSVGSTMQITSAMKMVSAAKLKRAQDAVTQIRPYAGKIKELLENVSGSINAGENPYARIGAVKNVLIVPISSNRGLAGAFNANVIKKTWVLIKNDYKDCNVTVLGIGKKVQDAFRKTDHHIVGSDLPHHLNDLLDGIAFGKSANAASKIMETFSNKQFDKIVLIYNQFKNAAVQITMEEQFLPIAPPAVEVSAKGRVDYSYEPNQDSIVKNLIPLSLKTQLHKALLDSTASEHGARMTAMHKATDNAKEMLRDLKISYNKARQAAITTEILEIVAGAEALNG